MCVGGSCYEACIASGHPRAMQQGPVACLQSIKNTSPPLIIHMVTAALQTACLWGMGIVLSRPHACGVAAPPAGPLTV